MQNVIIKPIVTEKSMQGKSGSYTFMVAKGATKKEIREAFKKNFDVTVVAVSTSKISGKRQRVGQRRVEIEGSVSKKATIILKKGDKLSIFESGEEKDTKKKKK
jgi:large subunit ribosomal protein L23